MDPYSAGVSVLFGGITMNRVSSNVRLLELLCGGVVTAGSPNLRNFS